MIFSHYSHSPFGELILGSFEGKLCLCDWRYRKNRETIDRRIQDGLHPDYTESESDITAEAEKQLQEYFSGSNGEMTGYAGGVTVKRKLLQLEGSLSLQHTLPFIPPSP